MIGPDDVDLQMSDQSNNSKGDASYYSQDKGRDQESQNSSDDEQYQKRMQNRKA